MMDVVMPKMGESVSEGTVIKWHKKVGDAVKRDEIIFEISTDKVDTEIPSPSDGVISDIRVNEGDTVEVGTVVAVIDGGGSAVKKVPAESSAAEAKPVAAAEKKEEIKESAPIPKEEPAEAVQPEQAAAAAAGGETIEIKMPKMGESVMEGTIIKWHKKVGEPVKKDETIFEISTDKVDTEVPAPSAGVLSEILVAEQETVSVDTVVAKLTSGKPAAAKEAKREEYAAAGRAEEKAPVKKEEAVESSGKRAAAETAEAKAGAPGNGSSKFLSPLVLNIARTENISFEELDRITGTGQDGRVTKKDILSYIESKGGAATAAEVKQVQPDAAPEKSAVKSMPEYNENSFSQIYSAGGVEKIPMDNIRQKIMQHMINSRDTSVHVTAMLEVDMTRIHNFIQRYKEEFLKKEGVKLTYMPFIAMACVKALKEFPLVNASIEGSTIVKKKYVNLGIAVAVEPNGLIVPNIKNADQRNTTGLAKAIYDVAQRSRNKKLTPDDITDGTFTITNYGVFGTIFGTPVINQPEVAILGVGTVIKKPVVVEVDGADTIAIKPIMALTLSHDHRLVDGMLGGKFLKYLKDTLEGFTESSF